MNESATKELAEKDKAESVQDGNKDAFDALLKSSVPPARDYLSRGDNYVLLFHGVASRKKRSSGNNGRNFRLQVLRTC